MIINIIANTYSNYHRQNVAVDSWRHLQKLAPDIIRLHNIQFKDASSLTVDYPDIPIKYLLSNSQSQIEGATKNLPFMNELFNAGLEMEGDYFIVTNSDVIIMPSLIEYIINSKPRALPCSRLDIENIDSFQRILEQQVKPVRWEIAGFDTFVFEKQWAIKNKELFNQQFLLGKPLYDVVWAGYMKVWNEGEQPLGNGYPPYCFHIHHGIDAVTTECPEKEWNVAITKSNPINILMCNIMVFNLTQNLMRRTPMGAFMNPKPEERMIERVFFDCMRIDRNLT